MPLVHSHACQQNTHSHRKQFLNCFQRFKPRKYGPNLYFIFLNKISGLHSKYLVSSWHFPYKCHYTLFSALRIELGAPALGKEGQWDQEFKAKAVFLPAGSTWGPIWKQRPGARVMLRSLFGLKSEKGDGEEWNWKEQKGLQLHINYKVSILLF